MHILEQFKNNEITEQKLLKHVENHPELQSRAKALLNEKRELSDSDLDGIVGGADIYGGSTWEGQGADLMYGGAGSNMEGEEGEHLEGKGGDYLLEK